MRTTISLDDRLAEQMRRATEARVICVSAFITKTLDGPLKRRELSKPPPLRLLPVQGVHAYPRALDAQHEGSPSPPASKRRRPNPLKERPFC